MYLLLSDPFQSIFFSNFSETVEQLRSYVVVLHLDFRADVNKTLPSHFYPVFVVQSCPVLADEFTLQCVNGFIQAAQLMGAVAYFSGISIVWSERVSPPPEIPDSFMEFLSSGTRRCLFVKMIRNGWHILIMGT